MWIDVDISIISATPGPPPFFFTNCFQSTASENIDRSYDVSIGLMRKTREGIHS